MSTVSVRSSFEAVLLISMVATATYGEPQGRGQGQPQGQQGQGQQGEPSAAGANRFGAASLDTTDVPAEEDPFADLDEALQTPNDCRTASGAPGHRYWQQRADYVIDVLLDDERQQIMATEKITYSNQSPDELKYLWLQLDGNLMMQQSGSALTSGAPDFERVSVQMLRAMFARREFDGGFKIGAVRDSFGAALPHTIVDTMMRVDLPAPLRPGQSFVFEVEWSYSINHSQFVGGRTGAEFFEKDGNYIYDMAQWYPRLAAYTDYCGWQHKQYLGTGEFTLEFGSFDVRITVPEDHVVAATGVLQNPEGVLVPAQRARLEEAESAGRPVFIVTPEEALANQKDRSTATRTWVFHADQVRDFAWASSRKFIWDAQRHCVDGRKVMAMSFYPNEGEPLWSKYSTAAIIHTLNVYSRFAFTYPYPVAQSVNGPVGGMEYPMISFNGPRPEEDGTYSQRSKYGLISVVIHEVGHNYFPMTVNSDEREWMWMDEGLNTFLQYLAEQEWEPNFPSQRGEPKEIVAYMKSTRQVPIMTASDSLLQVGSNAYAKPAVGLNILRETILGRELFDFSFREYSRRWQFKRPTPADFFRTMEDASGVDLDWFFRGWFFTTDSNDQAILGLRWLNLAGGDPEQEKPLQKKEKDEQPVSLSKERNQDLPRRLDAFPELKDFYNGYDPYLVTDKDRKEFAQKREDVKEDERTFLDQLLAEGWNFYVADLENKGGLVMPVILGVDFTDGSKEELRIPAQVWRRNQKKASKLILTRKEIESLTLDPHLETADLDLSNNHFPPRPVRSRFQWFKSQREREKNPMQDAGLGKAPEKQEEAREKVETAPVPAPAGGGNN